MSIDISKSFWKSVQSCCKGDRWKDLLVDRLCSLIWYIYLKLKVNIYSIYWKCKKLSLSILTLWIIFTAKWHFVKHSEGYNLSKLYLHPSHVFWQIGVENLTNVLQNQHVSNLLYSWCSPFAVYSITVIIIFTVYK